MPDDVLVLLDGLEIANVEGFTETMRRKAAGTEIKLVILRAGSEKRLAIKLGERPAELGAAKPAEERPILQIDTGGHMAMIRSLAFTPDGKFIVSAGDDKVIRVWDWRAGKVVRTIRGQSGPGMHGQIYAMALSPDGRWLAAGGFMAEGRSVKDEAVGDIRLYDFASGQLKALLKGHNNSVHGLAFSSDSKRLISGSGGRSAIIWDVETQTLLHALEGVSVPVLAVGFTPDGQRAVTGSYDKMLRLWRVADGALIKEMPGHSAKLQTLSVSPKDGVIASGDYSGEIRLWDGKTGAPIKTLAHEGGLVGTVPFSPDGRLLLSTCLHDRCNFTQRIYDAASGKQIAAYTKHDNSVAASAFSPDGRLVATGGGNDREIHIWDPRTGETKAVLKGTGKPGMAVGFSPDGRGIAWGNKWEPRGINDIGPLEIALRLPGADAVLGEPRPVKSAEGWARAKASSGALSLQHRKGGNYGGNAILDLLKDGKPFGVSIEHGSTDGYIHRSYTFTPDGKQIVSGASNGRLSLYGLDGKKLGNFVGHESDVWAVAASPDGRYLVSASGDETVRLWNLKTRELLVTIFRSEEGEWVMWTPQGFFASSPAGAGLIGWQINHGQEHEAEYVTAAQLREHLNRPNIVARAIQLSSAEAAIKEARGSEFNLGDLRAKPVPRLRILTPKTDSATLKGGHAEVAVELEATPDPVKIIRVQVNGSQIAEKLPEQGPGLEPGRLTFDVPLAKGANKIAIAAVNQTGETVASVSVSHEGEGDLDKRGTLYILAIGVDKYPNLPGKDLSYAGADAKAFATAMEKRAGALHERVVKRLLVNGEAASDAPTAANILDGLDLLRRARQNDTVMLFVSGHGVNDGPNYRFAPTDAAWGEESILRQSTVVPWYAFQEALTGANGRRFLFLDTCHAGNAFNQRLLSDSYEANIMVYSSARGDQEALEDGTLGTGHGLFTYALVEGVNGGARDGAGEVRADGLRDFVKARVTALAAKFSRTQEPQYFRARDAGNYVLARWK